MFRGREVTHPERGEMILTRLADELAELAVVEQRPIQDGRNMTMMLGPPRPCSPARCGLQARAAAKDGEAPGDRREGRPGDHREAARTQRAAETPSPEPVPAETPSTAPEPAPSDAAA